jgi:glycosyltransferase involved in cell wall biosynthesis
MPPRLSVVINTLNEERNLPFALRSVRPWADEIVVVDMHSDDRTVEIARSFGARVFTHERMGFADPARAFACAQATGDWILVLDADELVPPPLSRRLRALAAEGAADVVRIPRLNFLLGGPLLHSGWNPERDRQLRFFRRGAVTMTPLIHRAPEPRPGTRMLDLPYEAGSALLHFNYLDADQFLERLNRYTSIEAVQALARGDRSTPLRTLVAAAAEWARRYVWHAGFRDGWRGFYLCLFMAFYRVAAAAKLEERTAVGPRSAVDARYRAEAERVLAGYGGAGAGDGPR